VSTPTTSRRWSSPHAARPGACPATHGIVTVPTSRHDYDGYAAGVTTPPSEPPPARQERRPSVIAGLGRVVGGLSRRVRTLLVSGVLFLVLLILAFTLPVPYAVLTPGLTLNTLSDYQGEQVIGINGKTPNKTSGNLNLTTIQVNLGSVTVVNVLSAWLQGDQLVVPESYIVPPGQTIDQVNQQNTADFQQSQDSAVVAAACQLGYPKRFGILYVTPDGPSSGKLRPEDVLLSVAGHRVDNYEQLKAVLRNEHAGTLVPVVIIRRGMQQIVTIKLGPPDSGSTGATMGVGVTPAPQCLMPFEVDLGLGDKIGGPSAGLMFTLGIIDKVGDPKKFDLTQGRFIAGTGTIDAQGKVGEIGGIQLKMIAARDAGATMFLAPAGNCSDVRGDIPSGLQVVRVSTVREAVRDLLVPADKAASLPGC
jgi:Lon-like protease